MSSQPSTSDVVELVRRPEYDNTDLKYFSLEELKHELQETCYRCHQLNSLSRETKNFKEWEPLETEFRLWETRKVEVLEAISNIYSEREKELREKKEKREKAYQKMIRKYKEGRRLKNPPPVSKEMIATKQCLENISVDINPSKTVSNDPAVSGSYHNSQSTYSAEKELDVNESIDTYSAPIKVGEVPIEEQHGAINSNYISQSMASDSGEKLNDSKSVDTTAPTKEAATIEEQPPEGNANHISQTMTGAEGTLIIDNEPVNIDLATIAREEPVLGEQYPTIDSKYIFQPMAEPQVNEIDDNEVFYIGQTTIIIEGANFTYQSTEESAQEIVERFRAEVCLKYGQSEQPQVPEILETPETLPTTEAPQESKTKVILKIPMRCAREAWSYLGELVGLKDECFQKTAVSTTIPQSSSNQPSHDPTEDAASTSISMDNTFGEFVSEFILREQHQQTQTSPNSKNSQTGQDATGVKSSRKSKSHSQAKTLIRRVEPPVPTPNLDVGKIAPSDAIDSGPKDGHSLVGALVFRTGIMIAALTLGWAGWKTLKEKEPVTRSHARQWNPTDES